MLGRAWSFEQHGGDDAPGAIGIRQGNRAYLTACVDEDETQFPAS